MSVALPVGLARAAAPVFSCSLSASRENSEKWVREVGRRSPGRPVPGRSPLSLGSGWKGVDA